MKNGLIAFLIISVLTLQGYSQKLNKPTGTPSMTKLNTNNVSTYFYNDGNSEIEPFGNPGTQYPSGSGLTAVFESGFLWGAYVPGDPQVRVGGSAYRQGLQPGKIISPGVAENPDLPKNRIYRVRRDVYPGGPLVDLNVEALDEGFTAAEVRLQYEKDWNEWPAYDGAPFVDINTNGVYEPGIDIPGIKGAKQTIWYVANDLDASKTQFMYGAQPLGIELQVTIWNYDITEHHNNTIFKKYLIINKSNHAFNEMYLSQWSDPDLGNAEDDFVGCDTMLNYCYCYNSGTKDLIYGTTPPAVGYALLQGAFVQGFAGQDRNRNGVDDAFDYGYLNGRRIGPGKINLPATASYYFARGDASVVDPTQGTLSGSNQFYNFFQGKVGLTGVPFTNPATNEPTSFALSGDPIQGTGWLDGMLIPPGSRRMGLASGPFNMAYQDTQEILIAEIISGGTDLSTGLKSLRFYNNFARELYDNLFSPDELVNPPATSAIAAYSSSGITIDWNQNYSEVENYSSLGYSFQGYNIYQLYNTNTNLYNGKRVTTFDLADNVTTIPGKIMDSNGYPIDGNIQEGTNSGIQRQISFDTDYLTNGRLIKGKPYYYAVSYYLYNPQGDPKAIEVFSNYVETKFLDSLPGYNYGDTLSLSHISGNSIPKITVLINDPQNLTGHNYSVFFNGPADTIKWFLKDLNTNSVLLADQQPADEEYFIDGFSIKVSPSPSGMVDYMIPSGNRSWSWVNGEDFGLEGFNGAIGNAYDNWFSYSSVPASECKNVLIKFADADTGGNVLNANDPNVSYGYRYLRRATDPPARPEFEPFIINPTSGYAYQDFQKRYPFAAFDVESDPPRRLSIGFLENNVEGGRVDGKYNPPSSNDGINNVSTLGPREWFFIYDTDYSEIPASELKVDILNDVTPMFWLGTPTRRGTTSFTQGDEFLIIAGKPYTENDVFTFLTPFVSIKDVLDDFSYQLYQNYPNPFNPTTTIKFSVPERSNVKLEIFNILGQKITTLVNSEMQRGIYQKDFNGSRYASGVYIYRLQAGNYVSSRKLLLLK